MGGKNRLGAKEVWLLSGSFAVSKNLSEEIDIKDAAEGIYGFFKLSIDIDRGISKVNGDIISLNTSLSTYSILS